MKYKQLIIILFLLFPLIGRPQSDTVPGYFDQYQLEIVLGLTVIVCVVAVLVLFVALYTIQSLIKLEKKKSGETSENAITTWSGIWASINQFKTEEQEKDLLTDHEYDGIKELDNDLPPWWLWGFYITIIFSVIYVLVFHVFQWAPLQQEEYVMEMEEAKKEVDQYLASQENLIDETNVVFLSEDQAVLEGKRMYDANCVACHGANGEGGVGPNLTDQYWKHGGDIKDIFRSIKYGIPERGMIAWQNQFNPKEMQQLASYIYTLHGTNPPNGKEPEGELHERKIDSPTDSTLISANNNISFIQ